MPSGNFLYPWARNKFLTGNLAWTSASKYKVMFLNAGVGTNYTWSGSGISGYAWNPVFGSDPGAPQAGAGYAITWLSQIPAGHRSITAGYGGVTGSANTLGITADSTFGNGVANASAASTTQFAVASGAAISAFVIYRDPHAAVNFGDLAATNYSPYEATMDLIAFFDSAIGMPVQGNGGDITIVWDTSANKIFKL